LRNEHRVPAYNNRVQKLFLVNGIWRHEVYVDTAPVIVLLDLS